LHLHSEHSLDELVNEILSVSPYATVLIWMSLLSESFLGRVKLEGPEEVVCFLEVGTNCGNLVDEVFRRLAMPVLSKLAFNNAVVSEWNSGVANLAESSLVEKLSNSCL